MHRIWRSLVLLTKLVPLVAYGPLQLNFGPPDLAVDGWEAAFATVTGTPFLQLNSQVPPAFGFWGGDYQGATHEAGDSDASSSFSRLPDGAYLCLMSVPIGSYNLEVSVGNHSGSASSCLELESGARIYDGSTASIQKAAAVVHKEALDSCLTLRSCVADAVVNTWKVEEIQCHSSCAFCTATGEADCAISCNDGRSLTSGQNGSFCLARVPYAPSSLSASQVTNSSLRLSWVSGFSGGEEITDHRVLLEGVEFGRTGSTDAFVDLSGLEGDTVYSFQVQAMSAAGFGDLSESLTVRTSPVLPWAPLELVVMAVGQYWANMSWSTPSYDGGASIVGYLVSAGDLSWSTAITEVAADGLQGYTWYTFQVQALTSAGLGAVNATTLRTLEVPPGPVQQLQVASVEQYTISLQWSAPLLDGGSNISGYRIWCEAIEGAGNFTAGVLPDENLSVRLEVLHGYTHYQCFVVALNALGLGESASIQERTLAVPPYQPGQPVLLQEDLHFVEISWTAAEGDPGANLTGYKIYGRTDGTWYVVINDTQCTNTTWQISNLEMYTAYDFAVAGLNDVGEGERSNSTAAFTAAVGLPHPPSEPLLNASHSSIEASWTLVNDGGTNVTGYVIELAADGAFDVVLNVSDSTFGVVQGLLGNLTYKVRVRAVTSSGAWSYPSTSVEVRTSFPVEPSQVPQLDVSALAPHTALANWTPVVDLGGSPLQGYEVVVKEGETVTTVIQTTEASVEITQLMGLQNYQFFVYAENGIGRSPSTSANLTMPEAEVPGVPQGLQVSNASFEWAAPQHDGGAALWGFEVWAQVDEDNWTMQEMTNETRINLTDLIGDTSYRYQVRAVNRIGAGSFAVSDVLHTGPSVPMAPRELTPVEVGQYQLRLTWLAPLKDGGAPIFAYRIWQRTGTGSLVLAVNSSESNATEVIVESLTRTTAYSFVVAGVNTLGVGSLSEKSMQVWTLPVAPAAVEQLQLEPSPSRLNFTWEAPDDGGLPIDFYTIEMHLEDLEDLESGFFLVGNLSSSGCRCFQLTDLMANRSYRLQIFAWNAVGRSPEAPKTLQTSEPDVPSAVQQLVVVMGNYSADLAWQPPAETGGLSGLYYEVTAIADHQLVQTTTETFVTIETLFGSRAYNVSVVACNTLGCGAASTISNLQTAAAEDQALLARQAASVAAIAAGLTAEQAAQAAGAAAASTAQNVGLSPELQTSLAATAAAQAANVNQLSAQKQAELAGEAAASAGALAVANVSMTELASAAGSAVLFVGSQAGLTPEELAVLAAQSATAVLQQHYNASVSQQVQAASAAVAVALTNASLTPAEEALLTGASVLTALRSGSGCDAELVAHAGEAAQSVASRTSMNVSDQAATSGQAAAQAAANCSMSPAMQAQLAGAAAAAAGATANLSSEEQTALAGQAASVAAIAAGLTAEQAAQAAGAAAASTAQNVGLSPELQTSLAATAAAQAANVNQLSAQKQAELAGEAAASAGALANMSMTELASAAGSAVLFVGSQAGLTPEELAVLAAQSATAVLQHHYNASLSQQAQVASAAVAVALTNASLTPAEEALLTGASVLTALRSGSGCDAELVAHAGEAAQSVASRTSMNVSDQAATSGQAAAQAAANCSMSPAMQAQLAGAAAAAAGATVNLSSEEQTALAGQAASVAAIAAGLTAEQAAQAAGAAAASTAQNVGLSPELQTSLAATAAAQAANVNQLSAQKQAELAGEAAASAGALANMNVTQIATVAASAAESVALEAGLSPSQASQLSSDALELAEERADCQLTTRDELRCLHRCMAQRLLMTLDTSDLLSCSGSFDETRVADELVFQMDFGSRPANFAQRLLLALGDLARGGNVGLAGLRSGSVRVALAVSGTGSAEDFADLEVLLSDVDQLKTLDSDLFATVQDTTTTSSTATSTQTTSSALEDSTSRPTTSTLAASSSTLTVSSGNVTSTGPATSTVATSEMTTWTTTTSADEGNESDGSNESNASLADPQFRLVDLPDDPRGLGVEIHVVLAVGATLLVTFAAVMWCCMRKALRSVESVDDFGGILPTPKPTEAWAAPETQVPATDVDARRSFRKEADNDAAWPENTSTSKARSEGCEAAPSTPRRERVGMGTNSLIALEEAETALATPGDGPGWEGAPETPRRERVGMGTNTLVALEEADNSEGQGVTCVAATRTLAEPAKTAEVISKPDVLQQLLSELQDENDPNEFNLPEEPDALQELFGALGMQLPEVAVPPERGHTAWSLPGNVEGASRGSPTNSTATLLQ